MKPPMQPTEIISSLIDYLLAEGVVTSPHTLAYRRRQGKAWLEAERDDAINWKLELMRSDCWHGDSLRQAILTGRNLYEWALEMEWYTRKNPFARLKPPPVRRRVKLALPEDAIQAMLDREWPSDFRWLRARAVFSLLYGGGLRANEARMLDVGDVDLAQKLVAVNHAKNNTAYVQILPDYTVYCLDEYLRVGRPVIAPKSRGPLFVGVRGNRIAYGALANDVKKVAMKVGVKATPHALRRSGATHLLQRGATIADVQHWLHHKSITSTQWYLGISGQDVARAVALYHPLSRLRQGVMQDGTASRN